MGGTETTGLTEAEREVIALLEGALEKLRHAPTARRRVMGHVEAALKCLQDPRESMLPSELNSANDG